jgi:plastocyanin domain-containing protein
MRLVLAAFLLGVSCQGGGESAATLPTAAGNVVDLKVTAKGFEPSPIKVKSGEPVTLKVTRKTDDTCATEIVVKDFGVHAALPLDKEVVIRFTPTKTGELKYGCAMDQMVSGVLVVE